MAYLVLGEGKSGRCSRHDVHATRLQIRRLCRMGYKHLAAAGGDRGKGGGGGLRG